LLTDRFIAPHHPITTMFREGLSSV